MRDVLISEHALEEPYYDGEVLALVEGGEEDRILVAGRLLRRTHGVRVKERQ